MCNGGWGGRLGCDEGWARVGIVTGTALVACKLAWGSRGTWLGAWAHDCVGPGGRGRGGALQALARLARWRGRFCLKQFVLKTRQSAFASGGRGPAGRSAAGVFGSRRLTSCAERVGEATRTGAGEGADSRRPIPAGIVLGLWVCQATVLRG